MVSQDKEGFDEKRNLKELNAVQEASSLTIVIIDYDNNNDFIISYNSPGRRKKKNPKDNTILFVC